MAVFRIVSLSRWNYFNRGPANICCGPIAVTADAIDSWISGLVSNFPIVKQYLYSQNSEWADNEM